MNELIKDAQKAISTLTIETQSLHDQIFELRRELKSIPQGIISPPTDLTRLSRSQQIDLMERRSQWEEKRNGLHQMTKRLAFAKQEIGHWNDRIFWEGQPIPDILPELALSVRQPWGYRILFEGKDIENRDRRTKVRGTIFVHSALTIEEDGKELAEYLRLPVGGLIGTVDIVDCVSESDSKWFYGPYGYVLANPRPMPFVPCRGMPGFFKPDVDWDSVRAAA
ncbi:MAG: hypothetical protein JKY47_03865 [Thalassospira sp.]|uniref:hypothetical protein n=1 Tax=Thalassospira sp. 11-3 TaxID=2135614 RepID=UPI000D997D5C|nr:hypothetical protein [Thalassospira sp. 11-3]MBL4839950.1 hypothetical protein [Thalassospira sp.]PXX30895.1 hypothetical protein C7967_106155 [Thalassospira sp. 11-3]